MLSGPGEDGGVSKLTFFSLATLAASVWIEFGSASCLIPLRVSVGRLGFTVESFQMSLDHFDFNCL